MGEKSNKRTQIRERQRRQKLRSNLVWGGIGIVVLAVIGFFVWRGTRPQLGEAIPLMQADHIAVDSDPGQYDSNPPTSGPHYPQPLNAGFYDTNNYKYPAGYLVHNLEHGYVIFWYNCAKLSDSACSGLKSQITAVMDEVNNVKVIAYPWNSMDAPVVMTSWGRLLKMQIFDAAQALAFYKANLNKAPEPTAP